MRASLYYCAHFAEKKLPSFDPSLPAAAGEPSIWPQSPDGVPKRTSHPRRTPSGRSARGSTPPPQNHKRGVALEKYVIKGGKKLCGEVTISAAKNSAVAILPAALLSDEPCIIIDMNLTAL